MHRRVPVTLLSGCAITAASQALTGQTLCRWSATGPVDCWGWYSSIRRHADRLPRRGSNNGQCPLPWKSEVVPYRGAEGGAGVRKLSGSAKRVLGGCPVNSRIPFGVRSPNVGPLLPVERWLFNGGAVCRPPGFSPTDGRCNSAHSGHRHSNGKRTPRERCPCGGGLILC